MYSYLARCFESSEEGVAGRHIEGSGAPRRSWGRGRGGAGPAGLEPDVTVAAAGLRPCGPVRAGPPAPSSRSGTIRSNRRRGVETRRDRRPQPRLHRGRSWKSEVQVRKVPIERGPQFTASLVRRSAGRTHWQSSTDATRLTARRRSLDGADQLTEPAQPFGTCQTQMVEVQIRGACGQQHLRMRRQGAGRHRGEGRHVSRDRGLGR